MERHNVEDVARRFDLNIVPIVGTGTLAEMSQMVQDGFQSQWGEFICEGLVARPSTEIQARMGDRIITKLKHKDFVRLSTQVA